MEIDSFTMILLSPLNFVPGMITVNGCSLVYMALVRRRAKMLFLTGSETFKCLLKLTG